MNKYITFGFIMMFIVFVTYIVDMTAGYSTTSTASGIASQSGELTVSEAFGLLRTWWSIITFQIDGFPDIINLIVFYPLNAIAIFMGLDIAKDLIPFT